MTLSIIVPICNVEKYLPECLSSVIKQKRVDEIICINDGSTDHCLDIIRKFEKKDNRIKVIDKSNSGYGDSVNQGIALATGDYVGILESDDTVVDDIYSEMMAIAEATNTDIVRGNFNTFETSVKDIVYNNNMNGLEYNKALSFKENKSIVFVMPAIWSAIYKKSFLVCKNLKLLPTPGASYQDLSFFFKTLISSESIYLIDKPVINYRCDSIGSSTNCSTKVFNIFNETAEMRKFILKNNLEELYPYVVRINFVNYLWSLNRLNENGRLKLLSRWIPELRDDYRKGYLQKYLWSDSDWNLVQMLLFNYEKVVDNISNLSVLRNGFTSTDVLKRVYPIYIYGAGKYGLKKKAELESLKVNVTAFIVTDIKDNPAEIDGIPVLSLDRMDRDGVIFLGVSERYRQEVLEILNKEWLQNNVVEF